MGAVSLQLFDLQILPELHRWILKRPRNGKLWSESHEFGLVVPVQRPGCDMGSCCGTLSRAG